MPPLNQSKTPDFKLCHLARRDVFLALGGKAKPISHLTAKKTPRYSTRSSRCQSFIDPQSPAVQETSEIPVGITYVVVGCQSLPSSVKQKGNCSVNEVLMGCGNNTGAGVLGGCFLGLFSKKLKKNKQPMGFLCFKFKPGTSAWRLQGGGLHEVLLQPVLPLSWSPHEATPQITPILGDMCSAPAAFYLCSPL